MGESNGKGAADRSGEGIRPAVEENSRLALAAEVWVTPVLNSFPAIDKDRDGFITRKEMEDFPGGSEKQKFLDNYEALQLPASFATSLSRGIGGKEGVAISDLNEVRERAKAIPEELRLTGRVQDTISRYYSGHELRAGRFRALAESSSVKPEDKPVFDYVKTNWREFKHDIGNQLNRDEAIIPSRLGEKVNAHQRQLEERFKIVRMVGR